MYPIVAQIDPNAVDVTAGQVGATLLMLTALAGSMAIIVVWTVRRQSGQPLLPVAMRQPLHIPAALMIVGVLWVALLAVLVLAMAEATSVAPVAAEIVEGEGAADERTDAGVAEEQAGEETASDEAEPSSDENAPSADEDAIVAGKSKQRRAAEVRSMIISNAVFQTGVFLAFGLVVLLVQQGRSRSVVEGVANETGIVSLSGPAEPPPLIVPANQWPDLDEPPPPLVATAGRTSGGVATDKTASETFQPADDRHNPYAAPVEPSPTGEDLSPDVAPVLVREAWHFPTELRWACEVFLVALLPTFALRLFLVWILDDTAQHPFLELLDEGVDWTIMAMIALMAVVIAPLAEELLYRVVVLGGFMHTRTVVTGWIVSSLLFAFAHGFPDSLALVPLAFAIGYAYIRRRSYRTVVLIHFLFNGFNMLLAGLALV